MILFRYRPDATGQTTQTVHLASLPEGDWPSVLTALCGILLHLEDVAQVTPNDGVPCALCLVSHIRALSPVETPTAAPALGPEGGPCAAEAIYRGWGWPVTLRQGQVWLALESEAVALMVPVALAAGVAAILTGRHCPPAMIIHPYIPEHRVLLAGEPFPVALPWPPGVHRVTNCLLLPPTMTPRGPLTWAIPPQPNALALCREIDVLAALRAEPPPCRTPSVPNPLRAEPGVLESVISGAVLLRRRPQSVTFGAPAVRGRRGQAAANPRHGPRHPSRGQLVRSHTQGV